MALLFLASSSAIPTVRPALPVMQYKIGAICRTSTQRPIPRPQQIIPWSMSKWWVSNSMTLRGCAPCLLKFSRFTDTTNALPTLPTHFLENPTLGIAIMRVYLLTANPSIQAGMTPLRHIGHCIQVPQTHSPREDSTGPVNSHRSQEGVWTIAGSMARTFSKFIKTALAPSQAIRFHTGSPIMSLHLKSQVW